MSLRDPYFAVTIPFEVGNAYRFAKSKKISFFAKYLHDCMKAVNSVENFRYRIVDDTIVEFKIIHASPTMMRTDNTFGFSFIKYHEDLNVFITNLNAEKDRIQNSKDLYPPTNSLDCIHCSALPWFSFTGHKEPVSEAIDSVPKIAFSKTYKKENKLMMNVSIGVNHALVDGYHVGLFAENFQKSLNILD